MWSIWQDRNRFIFDQKPLIPEQTGTRDAVDRVGIQTSFAATRARRASTDEEEHGGDDPNREADSCDCTGFTHSNADLNRNTAIPFARSERGERGTYGTRSIDRVGAEISFTAACVHRAFTDEAEHGGENPNREVTSCASADDDCGCSETRDERRNREQSRGVADRGEAENKAAVACVCRDSRGRLVGGFSKTVAAASAEQAEASALLETLEF